MTAESIAQSETRVRVASTLLGPYRMLVGNRDLALLLGGQVVSSFGDWLYISALVVLAYTLTHSATLVALLTFVRLVPYALFLPLSGLLADRFNPKALMIGADLGRCACMLGLLTITARSTLVSAFPLVFVATCLFSLFRPALNATLPVVVGDAARLVQANAIRGQVDSLAIVVGPAMTGLLILLGQTRIAFAINAATYLVSAATLLLVRVPPRPQEVRPVERGWLAETLMGFRFLFRENEGVLAAATLALAAQCVFGGAVWTLIAVLAVQTFHLGSQGTGFLNTAYGAGGLIGGVLLGLIVGKLRLAPGFIVAAGACAACTTLFGLSPAGILPFMLLALVGLLDVFVQAFGTTIIQTTTPRALLGRVFGACESTYILAMLVGTLVVGPLIATVGPRAAAVGLGLLGLVALMVLVPRLRRLTALC
jgi:MFS family permease